MKHFHEPFHGPLVQLKIILIIVHMQALTAWHGRPFLKANLTLHKQTLVVHVSCRHDRLLNVVWSPPMTSDSLVDESLPPPEIRSSTSPTKD